MSISSEFAQRKDKGVSFADFKKTWVDPVAKTTEVKPLTYTQKVDAAVAEGEAAKKASTNISMVSSSGGNIKTAVTPVNVAGLQTKTTPAVSSGRADLDRISAEQAAEKAAIEERFARDPNAELTNLQKYQQGLISVEDYRANIKAGTTANYEAEQAKTELGKQAAASALASDEVGKTIKGKVGDEPGVLETPEEGWASEEERLQAENAKAQEWIDYYKRYGEESQKQLGDVSGQVASFSDQLTQYQGALDALTAQINTSQPGLGNELTNIITDLETAGTGNITPEALAKIQTLADSGLTPEQFSTQARAILTSTVSAGNMSAVGVSDNGDSYTLPNGVTFQKGANGKPDLSVENLSPETNSYDIALMELATNNAIAQGSLESELEQLRNLSKSVTRATETARNYIENTFNTADNRVNEQMLSSMNELAYQERKLQI
ncbi:hypothetical protein KJ680_14415, partial [bacterium]|nr:hypothetical protein [bacterium]